MLARFGELLLVHQEAVETVVVRQLELGVHEDRLERTHLRADAAAHAHGKVDVEHGGEELVLADVVRTDGQLPVPPVHQDRELLDIGTARQGACIAERCERPTITHQLECRRTGLDRRGRVLEAVVQRHGSNATHRARAAGPAIAGPRRP